MRRKEDGRQKSQREAIRNRQEEEAKKFRESLIYENRIVAFIDVLGWYNAITKSDNDPELTKDLGVALSLFHSQKK